jgi:hypothetical protein
MSIRPLLFATLLFLATVVPAAAQTLPCQGGQEADPCVLGSPTSSIPVGTYDIRPRSLSVTNRQFTVTGTGIFKVLAQNITLQPGARFVVSSNTGNTGITFDAAGTFEMQSQGNSKSKIDVSGNFGGGAILLRAGGDITINGPLTSNATNQLGFGGNVDILSLAGDVTVAGDPSEGIKSSGNAQGGGGSITIIAPVGSIAVSTQLVPKGGDCSSCAVSLTAGGDIATTAQGVVDMRASGIGDGGFFDAFAGGNVNLAGNILANGSSDEFEGGSGGDVVVDADGAVAIGGRIEVNGAGQNASPGSETGSVDGDGGAVDIAAGTTVQLTAPILARSKGFGSSSDEIAVDGFGNVTLAGEIDISGDVFAGDISISSDALVTVSGNLKSTTVIDPDNFPEALGGTIEIDSCQINVTAAGQLLSIGPGGNPSGSNLLTASTGMTIAGDLTATDVNDLTYRTSVPVITGDVTPTPTITQHPNIACCGVQCPTTTTSTSTTSTTSTSSTSSTSSSSSSTSSTSTSSSSLPGATTSTTSSSSTVIPTTSTSSSTTVPTTTTTSSSTAIPTTTATSSTAVPTTTTPSTTSSTTIVTVPTTTTVTVPTTSSSTTTTTIGGSTSTTITSTTTSSTSTTLPTTTTTTSSTSTVAPSTSSTSVATSSTSTTAPPLTCLDTALGIDAVRCRLDLMSTTVGAASETELGGRKLAKAIAKRVAKATTLTAEPTSTKRLKKAAKQLKQLATKLDKGLAKGTLDATIGAELKTLATEAQGELAGLIAG